MKKTSAVNTYAASGVNIAAGNLAVKLIKRRVENTFRHLQGKMLAGIGGFSAAYEKPDGTVVAASTDGVGTKLMLAILMGIIKGTAGNVGLNTVGIDLVAMCVNDLLVGGVFP